MKIKYWSESAYHPMIDYQDEVNKIRDSLSKDAIVETISIDCIPTIEEPPPMTKFNLAIMYHLMSVYGCREQTWEEQYCEAMTSGTICCAITPCDSDLSIIRIVILNPACTEYKITREQLWAYNESRLPCYTIATPFSSLTLKDIMEVYNDTTS